MRPRSNNGRNDASVAGAHRYLCLWRDTNSSEPGRGRFLSCSPLSARLYTVYLLRTAQHIKDANNTARAPYIVNGAPPVTLTANMTRTNEPPLPHQANNPRAPNTKCTTISTLHPCFFLFCKHAFMTGKFYEMSQHKTSKI